MGVPRKGLGDPGGKVGGPVRHPGLRVGMNYEDVVKDSWRSVGGPGGGCSTLKGGHGTLKGVYTEWKGYVIMEGGG